MLLTLQLSLMIQSNLLELITVLKHLNIPILNHIYFQHDMSKSSIKFRLINFSLYSKIY
jgi:hypothetical protein